MSDKEKRELDAWIAEHVMGWHKVETHSENKSLCSVCGNGFGSRHKHYVEGFHSSMTGSVPFYTTDRGAAMEVLEKCLAKCSGIHTHDITVSPIQRFMMESPGYEAIAETLPLAICLFAKQLFTEEPKP